ncbi:hypothetical protein [Thalassospira alkalitolerans]|uniref:hypothetical protein n=1 Tax=Thalassospira alkalitolerans TaxID=1293890 RepID=UPI003AA8E979
MNMIEKMALAIKEVDNKAYISAKEMENRLHIDYVKAVLSALREPTDAMIDAGLNRGDWNQEINTREQREEVSDVFAAMIEAAEEGK